MGQLVKRDVPIAVAVVVALVAMAPEEQVITIINNRIYKGQDIQATSRHISNHRKRESSLIHCSQQFHPRLHVQHGVGDDFLCSKSQSAQKAVAYL